MLFKNCSDNSINLKMNVNNMDYGWIKIMVFLKSIFLYEIMFFNAFGVNFVSY